MDGLGWAALDYLRTALSGHPAVEGIRWHVSRTPADMLPHWDGLHQVILLDALPAAEMNVSLRWVTPQELQAAGTLSSHGLGIRETVELAAMLGLRPRLSILGLVTNPAAACDPADWLARHGAALARAVTGRLSSARPGPD
ncbi:MAG: hypothetical protein CMN57_04805 [Gammaproteobacteria bacterium]|nr:hypothetical protein [Gammaproteobacteria bacterium]